MSSMINVDQEPLLINPRVLVVYSLPKTGKTEALSQLPNHLLVDFDGSARYYKSTNAHVPNVVAYSELIKELKEMKLSQGKKPFKFIILDTITKALDTVVRGLAVQMYNKDEDDNKPLTWDITSLSFGKGHGYIREATKKLIEHAQAFAEHVIVVGHVADKAMSNKGMDLTIKELDLTGKLKNVLAANVDGLALMYRKEKNVNVLSFVHDEESVLGGTRSKHLNDEEIVISEMVDKKLVTHWDKIFI